MAAEFVEWFINLGIDIFNLLHPKYAWAAYFGLVILFVVRKIKTGGSLDKLLIPASYLITAILIGAGIYSSYYSNYKRGFEVVSITTNEKQEYVGYLAQRPFMDEIQITTTPYFPVLNCPQNDLSMRDKPCNQQIKIKKSDVAKIENP